MDYNTDLFYWVLLSSIAYLIGNLELDSPEEHAWLPISAKTDTIGIGNLVLYTINSHVIFFCTFLNFSEIHQQCLAIKITRPLENSEFQ